MSIFSIIGISDAYAANVAAQPSLMTAFLPWMVIVAGLFYFMIFRPQSKQAKEQRDMMADLANGDEVMTSSGIIGKISKMTDEFISLTIAENIDINMKKTAVAKVLPKGTMKSIK